MSAQRYDSPLALSRMSEGKCPECGNPGEQHTAGREFWLPRAFGCSLMPRGVSERIEQHRADLNPKETPDAAR